MDQVGTEVSVLGPDLQQIFKSSIVPGILLPIVGCSVAEQIHHVWLQGPADRGESRRGIQVVLAVVEQIIEQIKYVEPSTLRRRFGPRAWGDIQGARQHDQVLGQSR